MQLSIFVTKTVRPLTTAAVTTIKLTTPYSLTCSVTFGIKPTYLLKYLNVLL
jgi:hypothetical protein